MRRELQMTARAQHYVPGVMSVIAVTPVPHDATEGPVAIDARWQPGVPDAASRFVVIVQEVAKRGSLKWVIRDHPTMLYRSVAKIRKARAAAEAGGGGESAAVAAGAPAITATAAAVGLPPIASVVLTAARSDDGTEEDASEPVLDPIVAATMPTRLDPQDEDCVRKTAVRLLQHVETMHLHGIVHLRISIDTVIFDDTGCVVVVRGTFPPSSSSSSLSHIALFSNIGRWTDRLGCGSLRSTRRVLSKTPSLRILPPRRMCLTSAASSSPCSARRQIRMARTSPRSRLRILRSTARPLHTDRRQMLRWILWRGCAR